MRSTLALSLIFSLCALLGADVHAQTVVDEKQKLEQYNDEVARLEQANRDITANIAALKKRLPDQRSALAAASKERTTAEAKLADARDRANEKPSQTNQGLLENARFKQLLVQRKYDGANGDLQETESEIAHLKATVTSNRGRLARLRSKIVDQRALIDRLAERERTEAQERKQQAAAATAADDARSKAQVEKLRKEHQAAVAEIERLKAMLTKKEAADREATARDAVTIEKAAPGAATAKPSAATTATAAATAAAPAVRVAAAPAAKTVAPPAATTANTPSQSATASSNGATDRSPQLVFLTDAATARAELQRIKKLAARHSTGSDAHTRLLHIKRYTTSGALRSEKSCSLRYLGGSQYRCHTRVGSGPSELIVKPYHWRTEFPDSSTAYDFILDNRDPRHPRLVLFDRDLTGN